MLNAPGDLADTLEELTEIDSRAVRNTGVKVIDQANVCRRGIVAETSTTSQSVPGNFVEAPRYARDLSDFVEKGRITKSRSGDHTRRLGVRQNDG